MGKLEGKVAIITGGNSGIGESMAQLFAKEGAKIAILARRSKEGNAVTESIIKAGGDAIFVSCDVANPTNVENSVTEVISKYDSIDILINNAGFSSGGIFPNESNESWKEIIDINLSGTFYMSKFVWQHLIESSSGSSSGSVINISSLAAQRGFSNNFFKLSGGAPPSAYYAAKAGVDAFTRYLASVGGHHNIRVNGIRPGQIITEMGTRGGKDHVFKKAFDFIQIIKGPGYPVDVANTALFLASEDSRFITGEILNVDGGMPAKL